MTTQRLAGTEIGEDTDDLRLWLESLTGCPEVNHTELARCANHDGDESMTWFYVEADAREAVFRRRCLACGDVRHALDSAEHWNHPPMYACGTCGQSMFEVAYGMHVVGGATVAWLAVAVRCVGCGRLDGVTDFAVPNLPLDEVSARL